MNWFWAANHASEPNKLIAWSWVVGDLDKLVQLSWAIWMSRFDCQASKLNTEFSHSFTGQQLYHQNIHEFGWYTTLRSNTLQILPIQLPSPPILRTLCNKKNSSIDNQHFLYVWPMVAITKYCLAISQLHNICVWYLVFKNPTNKTQYLTMFRWNNLAG